MRNSSVAAVAHDRKCISPTAVVETPVGVFPAPRVGADAPIRRRGRVGAQRSPDGRVRRVLERGVDVAGCSQRLVEAGQVAERDAAVDVVGEMPADSVRHQHEPGRQVLAHGMGGLAAVLRPLHAAVLGDRAQPVDHPPHRQDTAPTRAPGTATRRRPRSLRPNSTACTARILATVRRERRSGERRLPSSWRISFSPV